jgi:hypothetical protein
MNPRTVRKGCVGAAACAMVITAVSAWTLVNATASSERDPFHFASIMTENARVRAAESVTLSGDPLPEEVPDDGLPDLLALPPLCPGACA